MFPYISNTFEDEKVMLKSIGVETVQELFSDIPNDVKLNRELNINPSMSELEVQKHMKTLWGKNKSTEELVCFLGAGVYDHYIPSIIKHLTSRSEFYTAYTPYQPEISQGTLQAIFEYQTLICDLTGLDVANASMYDGATACAEGAIMAVESTKRKTIIVSKTVHPEIRKVLYTYTKFKNIELIEVDEKDGVTDTIKLKELVDSRVAGVIVQNPNFFGIIEDMGLVEKITHDNKALLIMSVDPISLAILKTPGEIKADIVVGEGQSLGNHMNFGGPYLGFMATTTKLMRKIPGRIVGQTVDVDGKRAFVLTLQAREQHIRREKASSNICSNQALNALTAAIYLITMGKQGLKEVAYQSMQKAHYAFDEIIKLEKYKPVFDKPFFKEFVIQGHGSASVINDKLLESNILGGYDIEKDYPDHKNALLLCVTEKRTKLEINALTAAMEGIK
ncbi:aminomethyl-transferring glycine dehydrogenase subunit GcvPA [Clostridium sp. CF012]|uniref:aminomethyl-transferring glycine dehydrogenase subunit GcvPA n=1 Tax=Clostridium sp. CF012 TaxID=2843319 RepID=UPI001C0DF7F9|nr:aminomethyl-transferring glycine dehydrogenase subunit GcvPA [Clostridium sp. CF012]MBU3144161.1 aminomethyl-transferring glycine dehydrogenase subunit GcvPA [Clostridium sp. CF012]